VVERQREPLLEDVCSRNECSIQGLAAVEAGNGNAAEAARLLGRADLLLGETGIARDTFDATLVTDAEASARSQLGDRAYEAAYLTG